MFWEAGTKEERDWQRNRGAKLLFMTARNEQLHHTSLALIGLDGLIIQTFWVFLHLCLCLDDFAWFPSHGNPPTCLVLLGMVSSKWHVSLP